MADCMFLSVFLFFGARSKFKFALLLLLLDPPWSKMYRYVESKRDCMLCEFFMVDSNLLVKLTDWLFSSFLKKANLSKPHSNASSSQTPTTVIERRWFCELFLYALIEGRSIFFLFIYILILFLFVFVDRKLPCKDDFMPYRCNYGHGLWMYLTSWRSW